MRAQLQEIMWANYGIIRKMGEMREAELLLRGINERTNYNLCQSITRETIEDRNLSTVALLVARASQIRRESRGTHKLEEYPFRDDENWLKHIEFKENDVTLADHI
jgi:succinate dehydrogenase/fumarate reductase flavoprotein subunit